MFQKLAFLLLTITIGMGCADIRYQYYSGAQKPPTEIATLHTAMNDPVYIRSIDGRAFSYDRIVARLNTDSPFTIELLPGPHTITVYYSTSSGIHSHLSSLEDLPLELIAQAGWDYHFEAGLMETNVAGSPQKVWTVSIVPEKKLNR